MDELRRLVKSVILNALQEDLAGRDITTRSVIPAKQRIQARVLAKSSGVVAGTQMAWWVFEAMDPKMRCRVLRQDGQAVKRGQAILQLEGTAHAIFAAERTALNLLGHLSGIATLTHAFVERIRPSSVTILDTRKTLPGLRALEKYAVKVGGGCNHRMGMDDAVLIKTNHLKVLRGPKGKDGHVIRDAVRKAQERQPGKLIEIEVSNLTELRAALEARPDVVMLDNWPLAQLKRAVRLRNTISFAPHPPTLLEVSGGVTLKNIKQIARSGIDRISIGRLTHSAPALDVALHVLP